MQLPPERSDEPEWLQEQRRNRKSERRWNYGAWTAAAVFPIPYAVVGILANQPVTGLALLATSIFAVALSWALLRRAERGSFERGLAIWSVPLHGLAFFVSGLSLLR